MSRFDRESAFFDHVGSWDRRHPILGPIVAWLMSVAVSMLFMVGPVVGGLLMEWLTPYDPRNGGALAVAALGGSALVGSVFMAAAALGTGKFR